MLHKMHLHLFLTTDTLDAATKKMSSKLENANKLYGKRKKNRVTKQLNHCVICGLTFGFNATGGKHKNKVFVLLIRALN